MNCQPCTTCRKRHYRNSKNVVVIRCVVCGKPRCISKLHILLLKTCGAAECKRIRRSQVGKARSPEWRERFSKKCKERGYGLWMKGRTTSDRQKQISHEQWLGKKNPRWKGGVPRSVTHKNWIAAHPEHVRHYHRIRKSIKRGSRGKYTLGEWLALKRAYLFTCPACGESEPQIKLTVDHIIPISKGGSNTSDNIQPLCGSCNTKKWATTELFDSSLIVAKFNQPIAA